MTRLTKILIIINFNISKIRLKQMNFRIKVCQGCRGPLQSSSGTVTKAPFDLCVARKERRTYKDPQTGQLYTPTRESDAHYHLRVSRIQAAEPSFVPCSLVISDAVPQKLHYKRVRSEGLLDLINVINLFHVSVLCFTGLYSCWRSILCLITLSYSLF